MTVSLYDDAPPRPLTADPSDYYIPPEGKETEPCIAQDSDPTTIVLCPDGMLYNASRVPGCPLVPGWVTYSNTIKPKQPVLEESEPFTQNSIENLSAIVVVAVGVIALVAMVACCSSNSNRKTKTNRSVPYGHHLDDGAAAMASHVVAVEASAPAGGFSGGGDCGGGGFSGGGFSGGGDCGGGGF